MRMDTSLTKAIRPKQKDRSGVEISERLTFRYKRELRHECIPFHHDDDVGSRLRFWRGVMMSMESQNNWMLRPIPLAHRCVSLALLSATASPAPSSQGTPEQRVACTPDVLRLCSAFIPHPDEITTCLREMNAELSDACRTAVEAEMKQIPGASDGTGTRKRTAR
jgi:hypothetical protein